MHISYKRSESLASLAPALVKVMAEVEIARKDSNNPHFKSTYADLASCHAACLEALTHNDFALTMLPSATGVEVSVTGLLLHASGEFLEQTLTMVAKDAGPQAIGSTITYARRYLYGMVGVVPDDVAPDRDDDGERGEGRGGDGGAGARELLAVCREITHVMDHQGVSSVRQQAWWASRADNGVRALRGELGRLREAVEKKQVGASVPAVPQPDASAPLAVAPDWREVLREALPWLKAYCGKEPDDAAAQSTLERVKVALDMLLYPDSEGMRLVEILDMMMENA